MCTLLKRILNTGLWGFSLLTLPAMATQISPGGVIHFRGAIVEAPCDVNTRQQQIELSCMRDGTMSNSLYETATGHDSASECATNCHGENALPQ
ncbi:type 1 fimbrial protein [Citrobacter portucalensis]|nr:type 1 fimbrial protein [Citrobacter portucalensis]MCX8985598.1 type 1 fimbrial protein [Citrobacter portucalensis]